MKLVNLWLIIAVLVFVGCAKKKNAPSKIEWTHIDGTKQYADVIKYGILTSWMLTTNENEIKSVDFIPNSITSIGEWSFYGCENITSITIPNSVTSIGDGAFSNCPSLVNVRVERSTPPSAGIKMFDNTHANLSIKVPNASVGVYKGATKWSTYADKITNF